MENRKRNGSLRGGRSGWWMGFVSGRRLRRLFGERRGGDAHGAVGDAWGGERRRWLRSVRRLRDRVRRRGRRACVSEREKAGDRLDADRFAERRDGRGSRPSVEPWRRRAPRRRELGKGGEFVGAAFAGLDAARFAGRPDGRRSRRPLELWPLLRALFAQVPAAPATSWFICLRVF